VTKNIGTKAKIVVATEENTDGTTSIVPSIAACSGVFPSAQVGIDVLADDDRIVNHNPQCDQEGKQREHVECLIELQKHRAGSQKRDWDSHRNPECQL
jgi:hypothetical protein